MINYQQSKFDCALTTMAASASGSAPGFSAAFAERLRAGAPPKASTLAGAFEALEKHLTTTKGYSRAANGIGPYSYKWPLPDELRSSPERVEILKSIASALGKQGYLQLNEHPCTAGRFSFECSDPTHMCNCWGDPCPVVYNNLSTCRALHLCSAKKFSAE